jgi:alanine racemase
VPPADVLPPRAELVIDLDAVRANVETLRDRVEPSAVMAVVKADGYGHGMVPSARAARAGGASWLGVAVVEEALALRAAGDTGRILTWLSVPGEDYGPAVAADVDLTAYSVAEVGEIAAGAAAVGRTARVQLKVDTGLRRGGAGERDWPDVVRAAAQAEAAGAIKVTGVWSHLACSDEPEHPANAEQERAFRVALDGVAAAGLSPEVVHLANSAAALTRPSSHFDLVRCGLATYGLSPVPQLHTPGELGLRPAMTARARVAVVKRVPAGSGVSYGHTYVTERETTLAVVPVGYAEGMLRSGSSTAPVLVAGRRRTVSGRVCMDQFVVDCADDPVAAGDEVVLFGPGGGGEPTAEEWARACGTISYEVVSRIGGRFVRTYAEEGTPR